MIRGLHRNDLVIGAAALAAAALYLFQEWRISGAFGFPLDDSWIHARFAQNLAEGYGFSYNRGVPVAGSTAPLWTLLLAGAYLLTGQMFWNAKLLGIVFYAGTGLLTRRLTLALGCGEPWALTAGIATIWLGRLAWASASGMEVPLAAFLVTAGLLCHVRSADRPGLGYAGSAALALSALARPESSLVFVLTLADRWITHPGSRLGRLRILMGHAVIFLLFVAPALAFNLWTGGHPLPATYYAKVEGGLGERLLSGERASLWSGLVEKPWEYLRLFGAMVFWDHPLLAVALVPGLLLMGRWALREWRMGGLLSGGALILHPIALALFAPYRGPDFQQGRYSSHLAPLACSLGIVGLSRLVGVLPRWRSAVTVALAGAVLLVGGLRLWPASQLYGWNVQNINAMQVALGRWVGRTLPKSARLALNDVGAIGYFSNRTVVDLMGLVSPEVLPYRRLGEEGVLEFLAQACPDYLIIFPTWFPRLSARRDLFEPIYSVSLEQNTVAGAGEMVVYRTPWNRWLPEPKPCHGAAD